MNRINLHNYEAFLLDYSEGNLSKQGLDELKAFAKTHPELEIDLEDRDLPHISGDIVQADFKEALLKTGSDSEDEELLDYLEGNLSPGERSAFEAKLSLDSKLAKELELYKKTILTADSADHNLKISLFKTEEDLIVNNSVIAYAEDQLSVEERAEFELELKTQPVLQKELGLVLKAVLTADTSVVYPDKHSLKKKTRIIVLFNYRTASVAAAVLLLFGFAVIFNYYQSQENHQPKIVSNKSHDKVSKDKPVSSEKGRFPFKSMHEPGKKTAQQIPVNRAEQNKKEKNVPVLPEEEKEEPLLTKQEHVAESVPVVEQKEEKITKERLTNVNPENTADSVPVKYNNLITIEEGNQEEEFMSPKERTRKGFWRRAVQVARQANKLGVKSIDGEENSGNRYRLSFNSFSVEKK